ncbi:hypothetical protein OEZ85_009597 [Tetradesmus obliquus]|uniref:Lon N-terminal domain-containing protein n=1 Tax=Tetradesmus obliquus TaxID=3088 RepID=A0ABY8U9T5_TETOB|nr:hypothetical protein OEZ85_009597 [Tetradesmus obliquus]
MHATSTRVSQRVLPCCLPKRLRHAAANSRRRNAGLPAATGPGPASSGTVESVISIPLFPLSNVLHPAQAGSLLVFEPRYLALFRDLQAAAPQGSSASEAKFAFGHILAAGAAPPALMQDSVGGLPACGVCATVKGIEELENGRLQVSYQGWRRFKLLTVDHDSKPYPMAAATWMDDDTASLSQEQQAATYALEQQVYGLLQQVASYMRQLEQGSAAGAAVAAPASGPTGLHGSSSGSKAQQRPLLPDSVLLFAPLPPSRQQSVADYLIKAGGSTGDKIATWQRMGSVYGQTSSKKKPPQDPYQAARDQLGKERRQELFSFAAASVLELGLPERLALLHCTDTAARLQYVAAAVQPFLADLVARVSLQQAMVKQ